MKASLKWKYETDKSPSADATFAVTTGDVKLRASITDAAIFKGGGVIGPSFNGVVLSLEKPDAFIVDWNLHKQDYEFQFMNRIRVLEKPLKITYTHGRCKSPNVNGTLEIDKANKVSANYKVGSRDCKLKYSYIYDKGLTTLEPSYEVAKNSWDFAVSQKLYDDHHHSLKASFQTSTQNLGLTWSLDSQQHGCFEIAASSDLGEKLKAPKVSAKWLLNSKHNGSFEIKASLNLGEKLKVPEINAKTTFNFDI